MAASLFITFKLMSLITTNVISASVATNKALSTSVATNKNMPCHLQMGFSSQPKKLSTLSYKAGNVSTLLCSKVYDVVLLIIQGTALNCTCSLGTKTATFSSSFITFSSSFIKVELKELV